jgi:hypothetical protein
MSIKVAHRVDEERQWLSTLRNYKESERPRAMRVNKNTIVVERISTPRPTTSSGWPIQTVQPLLLPWAINGIAQPCDKPGKKRWRQYEADG